MKWNFLITFFVLGFVIVGCVAPLSQSTITSTPISNKVPTFEPTPTQPADSYDINCETIKPGWVIFLVDPAIKKFARLDAGTNPQFSPNGQYLAYLGTSPQNSSTENAKGALLLFDVQSQQTKSLADSFGKFKTFAWSLDSSSIAYVISDKGQSNLYVYDLKSQKDKLLLLWKGELPSLTWSYDGKRIAFAGEEEAGSEIYIINIDGTGLSALTNTQGLAYSPAWSPIKNLIAYNQKYGPSSLRIEESSLKLMDLDNGNSIITLAELTYTRPLWSPDGQWVTAGGPTWIVAINHKTLERKTIISGVATFSPKIWTSNGMMALDMSCCGLREVTTIKVDDAQRLATEQRTSFEFTLGNIICGKNFAQQSGTTSPNGLVAFQGFWQYPLP